MVLLLPLVQKMRDTRKLLFAALILTVVAWQIPLGRLVVYPFTLLATYAHEMGHGLTAILMGASFEKFRMYADGSGVATWRGNVGAIARALISAGGLVGPSIAGVTILALSRKLKKPRVLLYFFGGAMLLSVVLVVRNLFGVVFVTAMAALLISVARYSPRRGASFLLQLLGAQLCLSVFRDIDYMFSRGAVVAGRRQLSDSAHIADALILPYWFWGALTAVFSLTVLAVGMYIALKPEKK